MHIKICRMVTTSFLLRHIILSIKIDGQVTCNFTSFSTVFQSYQDDRQVIMKGFVQWNLLMVDGLEQGLKDCAMEPIYSLWPQAGLEQGAPRS